VRYYGSIERAAVFIFAYDEIDRRWQFVSWGEHSLPDNRLWRGTVVVVGRHCFICLSSVYHRSMHRMLTPFINYNITSVCMCVCRGMGRDQDGATFCLTYPLNIQVFSFWSRNCSVARRRSYHHSRRLDILDLCG
jgi:hypothetical protein